MAAISAPFGVYVHWPFCAAKCPYCDFNSHVRHNPVDQKTFIEAYFREIEFMAALAPGRTISSVFFGGGTPSLMEPETVGAILDTLAKHWTIAPDAEISMEANPTSVEANRFRGYRSAGVNRVSLGVQSLDDRQLQFLGRLHTAYEAKEAIGFAQDTFERTSFDLIYSRPEQTAKEWEAELSEALSLAAGHLSLYQLTIEEGTRFFDLREVGKLSPLPEEPSAELYELTQDMTRDAGYETYEISNHAMPGHQCEHNLVYWRGHDYAGIGPGAHGRITTNMGREATVTLKNPEEWWQKAMVEGVGLDDRFTLLPQEQADEYLLMGLRLAEGISKDRFAELSGRELEEKQIDFLSTLGLVEKSEAGLIRATPKGFLVLDAVVADLAA